MIEKIFILHHTHVDFGYTGDRDKVCDELVAMVDNVTELVRSSSSRPEPERFRWTHEVSWPVLEYIRRTGGIKEEHLEQIRNGYVELTALYMNPTDLFDRYTFEVSTDYACNLAREHSLPLTTAMFSDCPGIPWSIVDILAKRGVRYLSASPDFIMSYPLDVERPFYWEGPEGGRVLVWFTEWRNSWYAEGLFALKLHEDPAKGTENLLNYISKLEGEGYRWKGLAIHVAMDNEGALPQLMDFVKFFNANESQQSQRKVQLATNRDFFEYMESNHSKEFSVHRGAWPDWWANGNASAAFETSCSRRAKASLRRSIALADQTATKLDEKLLHQVTEDILMFDEHTWGFQRSVTNPWDSLSRLQWSQKRAYALKALEGAARLESDIGLSLGDKNIAMANPFATACNGVVYMPYTKQSRGQPVLKDTATGELIASQRIDGKDTAGRSGDCYSIRVEPNSIRRFERLKSKRLEVKIPQGLENDYFRIDFDKATGAITSIFDKQDERQLCDEKAGWSFAELIHERIKRGSREAIYDVSYGTTNPESKRPVPDFIRKGGHASRRRSKLIRGPVFNSLVTFGSLPGVRFVREVRLYHSTRRIDVLLQLDKDIVTSYESLYLAFPFAAQPAEIQVENAGAAYRAGIDQLPGSATDWHSLGEYVAVDNQDNTVVLVPHDCPLIQIGDINTGKWAKQLDIHNSHIYSWLMNNMWFTNFPPYQEGRVNLSWSLTSYSGGFDRAQAEAFAHEVRVGIVSNIDSNLESVVW